MLRFCLFFLVFLPFPALAEVRVLATIAPLAGIAAAVTEGVSTPDLLIRNNDSPHTYQLTPADAALLADTDIILWVGGDMESFLAGKLATLAPKAVAIGVLDEDAGMMHLSVRQGGIWGVDQGDHEHDHGHDDPHAWLDPDNAIQLANRLAEVLATRDSANADRYRSNAEKFAINTVRIDAELKQLLAPLADKGFIVFHDAYQYFERRYGLRALGAISFSPEVPPSAQQLATLRQRIVQQEAVCVFAEPQFRPDLVKTLLEGTSARTGMLNPDASDLPVSSQLYADYLRRLAQAFIDCLG